MGNLASGRGDKQGWACKMGAAARWGREEDLIFKELEKRDAIPLKEGKREGE